MWIWIGIAGLLLIGFLLLLWSAMAVGARDDELMARWYDDKQRQEREHDGP